MNTISGIEKGLLDRIKNLSIIDELVNSIFSPSQDIMVSIVKKSKNLGIDTYTTRKIVKNLKNHRIIYKDSRDCKLIITDEIDCPNILVDEKICEYLSSRINRDFLNFCENSKLTKIINWKYPKNNKLHNFILGRNEKSLTNKIIQTGANESWCLMSDEIFEKISKNVLFYPKMGSNCCGVVKQGFIKLDNFIINVYSSDKIDRSKIYFGSSESINLVVDDKIIVKSVPQEPGTFTIDISYQFLSTGQITILCL